MAVGDADLSRTPITPAPAVITDALDIVVIDLDGGERIYHNGRMQPPLPADGDATQAHHYGPYSVAGFNVPAHWRNAWWTDRSAASARLKIANSPAVIAANHWEFAYGDIGVPYGDLPNAPPYTIMGSSDDPVWEGTTGERPQIGLITDQSAKFMLTDDPDAMLIYAQVGDTCPNKYLDDATGQPIDLLTYPGANAYDQAGRQGTPWLVKGPPNPFDNGYPGFGGSWGVDQAHHPEYAATAFRATGSPALLLQVQCHATAMIVASREVQGPNGEAIPHGQDRGIAWALRDCFNAWACTRDYEAGGGKTGVGTPFKTAAYWKTILDNARVYYSQFMTPSNTYNLLGGGNKQFATWQVDYQITALAKGLLLGATEWLPLFLFILKNAVDRMTGAGGALPAYSYYYVDGTLPTWGDIVAGLHTNPPPGIDPITDVEWAKLQNDPMNGFKVLGTAEYMMTTRAGLAMACYIDSEGIAPIRAALPNLDLAYSNAHKFVLGMGGVNPRQSVLASRTTTTQPPPTEIHMSATKLRVGETKHVTLAITPADADQTGLTYVAAPDGIVSLTPDLSGVAVTRTAPGVATITASLNGLTATAEADDAAPLALSLALSWDS